MTHLELCCKKFNKQGGTIHQYSKILNLSVNELLNMSQEFLNIIITNHIQKRNKENEKII